MEVTGRALNSASLAIYPVDARGLVGIPEFSASNRKADLKGGSKALQQIQRTPRLHRSGALPDSETVRTRRFLGGAPAPRSPRPITGMGCAVRARV